MNIKRIKDKIRYWVTLGKRAATDKRLPRGVRWIFMAGLAVKCWPVDFGIDEALLGLGIILLAGPYRHTWSTIKAELDAELAAG